MSPRTTEQYQDLRDHRRNQLLDAAMKIFAKRGLAASKITDIAQEANLSHGLVHHYFKSKEEIFIEVTRRTIGKSAAAFARIAEIQASPLETLKMITQRNMLSVDVEENALSWLFIINVIISDVVPDEAKKIASSGYAPLGMIVDLIRKGQRVGEIAAGDPERLTVAYWAMIQGLILFRYNRELNLPLPEIDTVMKIFKP